jgi:hypothetical protein
MFLRSNNRKKDGKDHRYFSIVENHRISSGKTVQRTVLYLGEINDQQQAAWSCGALACSAVVGWRASCGVNWDCMNFGMLALPDRAKTSLGKKCCNSWW